MKNFLLKILKWLLKTLAQLTIWRYKPGIIGITGSVGKTSAKEAIFAVLSQERRVRRSSGNFNNELGLPLTILGDWQEIKGLFFWPKVILLSLLRVIFKVSYPEILVLEYGADKPGDIRYLLKIAKPQIGVITAVGEIPVHVEFYSGPEAVAREKSKIIEILPANGFAVLNSDDITVMEMKNRTRAHLMTFGFNEEAQVKISNFENQMEGEVPEGISFKLEYGGSFVPVKIKNNFGRAPAYAAAAAAAVGLIFGLNLVKISEGLVRYQAPPHRLTLVKGVKNTWIIDDCYNASPLSMEAALEVLRDLKAKRKIAVLGDMLEIGRYTPEAHEVVGKSTAKIVDLLFTVGPRARFIAEAAEKAGLDKNKIFSFDTVLGVGKVLEHHLHLGDLVLIKASRAINLDKVVEEIKEMA